MLTKGAIGNLVNRYRAVLKKCNLINTFGSLAVASMLVLGGAGVAEAYEETSKIWQNNYVFDDITDSYIYTNDGALGHGIDITAKDMMITSHTSNGLYIYNESNLYSSGDIVITSKANAMITATDAPATVKLTIETDGDLILNTPSWGIRNDRGSIDISAKNIILNCGNGISNNSSEAPIKIEAENLEVNTSDVLGLASGSQDININVTNDVTIKNNGVAALRSNSGNIKISAGGSTVIEGTIRPLNNSSTGNIEVSFSGEKSYFTGHVEDGAGTTSLSFSDSAQANFTDDSQIDKLAIDKAVLNISAGINVGAGEVIGNGGTINLEDAAELGSFSAADGDAAINVQATDAYGKVKNADEVSAETLKKMKAQVTGLDNVTASAAEGDVNGAITVNAKGKASTARNTLMDAALQQASVTTLSIDKLLTNDVRKRLGDIRNDKNTTGVWMRWDGGKLQGDGLSNDFNTIQIGGDTKVAKNCRLGVAGSFSHGDAEFARGTAELEGFSLASYATWMGDNGMFADVVARLGQFNNEMNVEGRKGKLDNRVFSLSGEYGWRLPVCEQFFVEPQVELAYTYVSSDTLELGEAKYLIDSVDSLTGRAGVVVGWNLPDDRGNVYARASVLQQFMGDAKITGSINGLSNVQKIDGDDTWLEYGIGANVKLTDKTYIWADVERTEGATIEEEWRGTVGIRYSF